MSAAVCATVPRQSDAIASSARLHAAADGRPRAADVASVTRQLQPALGGSSHALDETDSQITACAAAKEFTRTFITCRNGIQATFSVEI